MSELTRQEKADLNRRARAHGLPDLWPEAVRYRDQMQEARAFALYEAIRNDPRSGRYWMETDWHRDPLNPFLRIDPLSAQQGIGPPLFLWPIGPPVWQKAPSLWSRLRDRLRYRVGLP